MANNVNKKQQEKLSRSAVMLAKLDLSKDERLTRTPIETGRISHFFSSFKKNYSELMLANLLLMVFLIPALVIIFYLTPTTITAGNASLDFNGEMGLGFGGRYETSQGLMNIYNAYEMMFLFLIPCFSLFGIGMAGLYYCCRNVLWGVPIKIRVHFFRGIKKRWAEYLLAFTYLGGVIAMVGCSILEYMKHALYGTANAGHWVFMIVSVLLMLLSTMYLMVSLPMEMSFRYKFKSVVKNSLILNLTMGVLVLILIVVLALPLLLMLNSFMRTILFVAIAMIGFAFYVLADVALAHNMFDTTIIPLFEHDQKRREREEQKERQRQNRAEKSAKARKKKRK